METTPKDAKVARLSASIRDFFKDRFNLKLDQERESVTKADIAKGTEFKGATLWILMFAILIASVGLNVNSTAVIIGAMLISPLMGPIIGIGLGAGVYDIPLIQKGARNLLIAMVISILTSTLYFLITPLGEAQSELLSRTQPTLWDVFIAFCGGMAGIIAGSRKEKTNAIPGVAIATALMPPLCTAGYGLAHLNWFYFFGALYLFFINCVFISVSTFLVVRALKYKKKKFENPIIEKRVRQLVSLFVIVTVIPSVYLAYDLVRKSIFEQKVRTFISQEFDLPDTQVIKSDWIFDTDGGRVDVTLFGRVLSDDVVDKIKADLSDYGLDDTQLFIRQAYQEENVASLQEVERMSQQMRTGLIEDLYRKNEEVLNNKDEQIDLLENELSLMKSRQYPLEDISKELKIQYADLNKFTLMDGYISRFDTIKADTVCFALVEFNKPVERAEYQKIGRWLKQRLKIDSVQVISVSDE